MIDAPRVTVSSMQEKVANTIYLNHGLLTIAVITLQNGFTVTGESACVSAENYNQALGEKYAYEAAFNKIWPLEGYLLKEQIYRGPKEHSENPAPKWPK